MAESNVIDAPKSPDAARSQSESKPVQQFTKPFTKPAINPWVVALTVTLATFMELLDTSIATSSDWAADDCDGACGVFDSRL